MSSVRGSNNCLQDVVSSGSIVPFYEKFLQITQPVVIEFSNLPLRTGISMNRRHISLNDGYLCN